MVKYTIIKNGLLLTLDEKSRCGYFTLVIHNDKICEVDFDNRLNNDEIIADTYPGAELIDAGGKLLVPAFLNLNVNSSYSLCKFYTGKLDYSNISEDVSLKLIEKYFIQENNKQDLLWLLKLNYFRALLNGELILNETSNFINKDFFYNNKEISSLGKQIVFFTSYNNSLTNLFIDNRKFHFLGFKEEELINNYSLNSIKKYYSKGINKIFLEILQTPNSANSAKNVFGKSIIRVLNENGILIPESLISNPVYLTKRDIEILINKNVNILFCPSDLMNLSGKEYNYNDYLRGGVNISFGTGITGNSLFDEMKLFASAIHKKAVSYESVIRMACINPARILGVSNLYGSIQKNKSANILFFNINDMRNWIDIPELHSENVSGYIINKLTTKDITDVMLKGEYVVYDGEPLDSDFTLYKETFEKLREICIETGNYRGLKEKQLMDKRVREISRTEPKKKQETKLGGVAYAETKYFDEGQGDFRVIGIKTEEVFTDRLYTETPQEKLEDTITEISDINGGIDLFGPQVVEEIPEYEEDRGRIPRRKKTADIKEKLKEKKPEEIIYKKQKMRFGFSEDESSIPAD